MARNWQNIFQRGQGFSEQAVAQLQSLETDIASLLANGGSMPAFPEDYGAAGDGVTDDTAALALWAASGKALLGLKPSKTYLTTATVTIPAGSSVYGNGSIIKASAAIAGPVMDTPVGTVHRRTFIQYIVLDCNDLAQTGLYARYFAHMTFEAVTILNFTGDACVMGDTAAPASSYEAVIHNLSIDRPSRTAAPSGKYGVWFKNCSDSEMIQSEVVGAETSIRNDGSDTRFIAVHCWGYSNSLPITCFDENGTGNQYGFCVADTPTTYGFRIRTASGGNNAIIGGKTYLNSSQGIDNTVIAIQVDEVGSSFFTVLGHHFHGNDGTHRLKQDIAVADAQNPFILSNQYTNVVTQLNLQNRFRAGMSVTGGLTSNNTLSVFALAQIFAVAGNTRFVQFSSGGSVAGASARWQVGANATAEGGANAGSDFDFVSRTDAGSFLTTVLRLVRANGVVQSFLGIATKQKSGTPTDADWPVAPPDGTIVGDSTGSKIWIRLGGAWKSVTVA